MTRRRRAHTLCLVALAASGCASEPQPTDRGPAALPTTASNASGVMSRTTGPIAAPVEPEAAANAYVRVAVRPVGAANYDGQRLPLVSPDADWIATQVGRAPDWPTTLAATGAIPPGDLAIEVLRRSEEGVAIAGRVAENGLLLGRSANRRGFLVEAPRVGGARWIGFVAWNDLADVRWLVRSEHVNAHATLLSDDGLDLAWSRRDVLDDRFDLVIRTGGRETVVARDDVSHLTPFTGDRDGLLCAFELARGNELHLAAWDLRLIDDDPRPIARTAVMRTDDPLMAWQAVAGIRTPTPHLPATRADGQRAGRALFHHPRLGRMHVFDIPAGAAYPLAPRSIAGAWNPAPASHGRARGVFLTTPDGLAHQALFWLDDDDASQPRRTDAVRALADDYVPVLVDPVRRIFLLIGPDPDQPTRRLRLVLMQTADDVGWFRAD